MAVKRCICNKYDTTVKGGEINTVSSSDRLDIRNYASINAQQIANTPLAEGWNMILSADAQTVVVENALTQNLSQTKNRGHDLRIG